MMPIPISSRGAGVEALVYTIKLTNGEHRVDRGRTDADRKLVRGHHLRLSKDRVIWTDGGVTSSDDWESAVK